MKRIAMLAGSALLLGRGLVAQDTTKAAAPAAAAAAPAAATPQVTVLEAVVARSVVDRQPQDTGSAFPADVGQLNCWTKLEGAGGSRAEGEAAASATPGRTQGIALPAAMFHGAQARVPAARTGVRRR